MGGSILPSSGPEGVQTASPLPGVSAVPEKTSGAQETERPKTIAEAMQEAREKAERNRDRFKIKSAVRYGDIPVMAYAKLAKARNRYEVGAAAGYARRQMAQLQRAMHSDPERRGEIRAAMGQLQKAQLRAGRKVRDLEREASMERQRRKKAEQQRQAMRIRNELQRRRTCRSIREGAYLHEAAISSYMQIQMSAALEKLQLSGSASSTPSGGTAASPDAAAVPASPGISLLA